MKVWVLRQEPPAVGMIREIYEGAPIMTATVDEAERYPTSEAAEAVLAALSAGLVPLHPVEIDVDGARRLRGESASPGG